MDLENGLEHVFFAGFEVSVLSIPALVLLLGATPRGPVSLAALTAIGVATVAVGTLRGGWVTLGGRTDADDWPRPGDPYTIPLRSAYYSATIAGAAYAGAAAHVALGAPAAGIAVSALVSVLGASTLPRAIVTFRKRSRFGNKY